MTPAERLKVNCVDSWDWSYVEGSSLADGNIQEDIRSVLEENDRLRQRVLSAAGDDLCRLTQEEIDAMASGAVKIPPKEEFLASCERFHTQMANESGVMQNCMTLAQLIAENERLREELATALRK